MTFGVDAWTGMGFLRGVSGLFDFDSEFERLGSNMEFKRSGSNAEFEGSKKRELRLGSPQMKQFQESL